MPYLLKCVSLYILILLTDSLQDRFYCTTESKYYTKSKLDTEKKTTAVCVGLSTRAEIMF